MPGPEAVAVKFFSIRFQSVRDSFWEGIQISQDSIIDFYMFLLGSWLHVLMFPGLHLQKM